MKHFPLAMALIATSCAARPPRGPTWRIDTIQAEPSTAAPVWLDGRYLGQDFATCPLERRRYRPVDQWTAAAFALDGDPAHRVEVTVCTWTDETPLRDTTAVRGAVGFSEVLTDNGSIRFEWHTQMPSR